MYTVLLPIPIGPVYVHVSAKFNAIQWLMIKMTLQKPECFMIIKSKGSLQWFYHFGFFQINNHRKSISTVDWVFSNIEKVPNSKYKLSTDEHEVRIFIFHVSKRQKQRLISITVTFYKQPMPVMSQNENRFFSSKWREREPTYEFWIVIHGTKRLLTTHKMWSSSASAAAMEYLVKAQQTCSIVPRQPQ